MDTSGTKLWLPGISDTATLDAASALCGTTAMRETHGLFDREQAHHDYYARHPVMTPEMIRQLPARYALVVRGGMSPVVARLSMAWTDPAFRRARHHRTAIADLTPVPEAAAIRNHVPRPRRPSPDWNPDLDTPITGDAWDDPTRYPWH
jgi:hypothetical protein